MILHEIHDLSNSYAVDLLKTGLASISDADILKNYHPDYSDYTGNLFFILKNGRYRKGSGKYYILEESGEYIGSAGWNEYEYDRSIAFALTRMYTSKVNRGKFVIANNILPLTLNETAGYKKVWMSVNMHNKALYQWFVRSNNNKRAALFNDWPEIYKRFAPIGEMMIYNTLQYVVELKKEQL